MKFDLEGGEGGFWVFLKSKTLVNVKFTLMKGEERIIITRICNWEYIFFKKNITNVSEEGQKLQGAGWVGVGVVA